MAYIGRDTDKISNVEVLDNITFDGSSSYTLQKNSVNFTPSSANTLLLSIDGVVQAGNFTVSGSTIDFGTAVAGTSTCDFVLHYGVGLITAPSDGTVTAAKLASNSVTYEKIGYNANQFRNIIINGSMDIAQRSTSVTGITNGSSGYHTVDRFKFVESGSPSTVFTQSQSTDVPTGQGFAKSLKMDVTTADASLGADDAIYINTSVEGQNLQYIKKGTSSAESLTLSFWVKSNITGTYIFEIIDRDNDRAISKSYTISSANTWEKKTITFAGDTTGALDNDNGDSFVASFWLAAGSNYTSGTLQTSWGSLAQTNRAVGQVNLADSTSNEWYITGVQLEVGTSASDFEFLPVDVNLQRCLRYYYVHAEGANKQIGAGGYYRSDYITVMLHFPVSMRAAPSLVETTGTDYYRIYRDGAEDAFNNFNVGIQNTTTTNCGMDCNANISGTAGHFGRCTTKNASALIAFNSEL